MRLTGSSRLAALAVLTTLPLGGCTELSEDEVVLLATMELTPQQLPPSPTNRVADDGAAAELGRKLFFDKRMSSDGEVSCASCHDPAEGWSDPRTFSLGVREQVGDRHSMPITAAALQDFFLWDGRADSLWSQALKAIENPKEMDFTRSDVARFVAAEYAAEYAQVFGELGDTAVLPVGTAVGTPPWDALTPAEQDAIDTVFVNVGKALEAYERRILCTDTRFDRWTRGEVELTRREEVGAARFLRDGCVDCHSGPAFSDGEFHNIGIGSGLDAPDEGRSAGRSMLADDSFNGGGAYSDDPAYGGQKLDRTQTEPHGLGAFRTPSLRGVRQRESFGHRGHKRGLEEFLDDMYDDPSMHGSAVGELDPLLGGVDFERERAMLDFLGTLDCPTVADSLQEP